MDGLRGRHRSDLSPSFAFVFTFLPVVVSLALLVCFSTGQGISYFDFMGNWLNLLSLISTRGLPFPFLSSRPRVSFLFQVDYFEVGARPANVIILPLVCPTTGASLPNMESPLLTRGQPNFTKR